jgi:hypothetical protein
MKKIRLTVLAFLMSVTIVNADGPLMMKGFHHDISFDEACKIMSTFKTDRGDFLSSKKHKKCGFGRNGLISYPHITGSKNSNNVEMIVLSPDVVNDLFGAESLNGVKFSQVFLTRYNWIDEFSTTRKYRQESLEHGWKLSINKKKWMKIKFFEKSAPISKK